MGLTSPPPTLSHRDMARPPHEDPDYQRQLVGNMRQSLMSVPAPIPQSPHKFLKLSPRPHSPKMPNSPRRVRGENKKCRKVYGMDQRAQWCTQCKWKKACSRFGDWTINEYAPFVIQHGAVPSPRSQSFWLRVQETLMVPCRFSQEDCTYTNLRYETDQMCIGCKSQRFVWYFCVSSCKKRITWGGRSYTYGMVCWA